MSIEVSAEVQVDRSRAEVAAYMFDPAHDAEWTSGVIEVKPLQAGLLRVGSKVDRVARFLGRRLEYRVVVVEAEADRFVEMVATEPFALRVRYELEEIDEDTTRVRIVNIGDGSSFFELAGPLLAKMVRRAISTDLAQLERRLAPS